MNEQLRDEVDDLHVMYSDMQASLDKEATKRKEDISKIKSLIKEETTKREECISDIRNEIETKEQKLKDLTPRSSNFQTLGIDVLADKWTLLCLFVWFLTTHQPLSVISVRRY